MSFNNFLSVICRYNIQNLFVTDCSCPTHTTCPKNSCYNESISGILHVTDVRGGLDCNISYECISLGRFQKPHSCSCYELGVNEIKKSSPRERIPKRSW